MKVYRSNDGNKVVDMYKEEGMYENSEESNLITNYSKKRGLRKYLAVPLIFLGLSLFGGCATTYTSHKLTPNQAIQQSTKKVHSPLRAGAKQKRINELYKKVTSPTKKINYEKIGRGMEKLNSDEFYGLYVFNNNNDNNNKNKKESKDTVLILRKKDIIPPSISPISEEELYNKIVNEMYGAQFVELDEKAKEWIKENNISFNSKNATFYADTSGISALVYHSKNEAVGVYRADIFKKKFGRLHQYIGTMYIFAVQSKDKAKISYKIYTNAPLIEGLYAVISNVVAVALANPRHLNTLIGLGIGEGAAEGGYNILKHKLADGRELDFLYLPFKPEASIYGIAGLLGDVFNSQYILSLDNQAGEGVVNFITDNKGNVYVIKYQHGEVNNWSITKEDNAVMLAKARTVRDTSLLKAAFRTVVEAIALEAAKKQGKGRDSHQKGTIGGGGGGKHQKPPWAGIGGGSNQGGPVMGP